MFNIHVSIRSTYSSSKTSVENRINSVKSARFNQQTSWWFTLDVLGFPLMYSSACAVTWISDLLILILSFFYSLTILSPHFERLGTERQISSILTFKVSWIRSKHLKLSMEASYNALYTILANHIRKCNDIRQILSFTVGKSKFAC